MGYNYKFGMSLEGNSGTALISANWLFHKRCLKVIHYFEIIMALHKDNLVLYK